MVASCSGRDVTASLSINAIALAMPSRAPRQPSAYLSFSLSLRREKRNCIVVEYGNMEYENMGGEGHGLARRRTRHAASLHIPLIPREASGILSPSPTPAECILCSRLLMSLEPPLSKPRQWMSCPSPIATTHHELTKETKYTRTALPHRHPHTPRPAPGHSKRLFLVR